MTTSGFVSSVIALALTASFNVFAGEPLRVCADPDNLPFSKSEGPERGIYVELAELVAQKINAAPVQYTWYLTYNQRRALRNTAKECDAVFALPAGADYRARGLQKTDAFLDLGYALVTAPGFKFNDLNDLKGKRLAVQFQTNPHILLSQRDDLPFTTLKTSDEVFAALGKGDIDAAFMWGPVAGFDNLKLHGGKWKVTPLTGPDLTGQVAVAVQRDKPELLKMINQALTDLKPEISSLASKYGFPRSTAVNLVLVSDVGTVPANRSVAQVAPAPSALVIAPSRSAAHAVTVPARLLVQVQQKPADNADKAPPKKPAAKPAAKDAAKDAKSSGITVLPGGVQDASLSPTAQLGRVRFNDQCSHCHGADGASPIRERDIRRLKMRYDGKWKETAVLTIKNGRNDLGMPPWKDILKEPEIEQLLSFIDTLQK